MIPVCGEERDTCYTVAMPNEGADKLAAIQVPDTYGAVSARCRQTVCGHACATSMQMCVRARGCVCERGAGDKQRRVDLG